MVRFIRSDQRLDIFGGRLLLPPETGYAYVEVLSSGQWVRGPVSHALPSRPNRNRSNGDGTRYPDMRPHAVFSDCGFSSNGRGLHRPSLFRLIRQPLGLLLRLREHLFGPGTLDGPLNGQADDVPVLDDRQDSPCASGCPRGLRLNSLTFNPLAASVLRKG